MCGISGMIMKGNISPDMARLRQMNDAAKHRGPDGEGFYCEGKVGFCSVQKSGRYLRNLTSGKLTGRYFLIFYSLDIIITPTILFSKVSHHSGPATTLYSI